MQQELVVVAVGSQDPHDHSGAPVLAAAAVVSVLAPRQASFFARILVGAL